MALTPLGVPTTTAVSPGCRRKVDGGAAMVSPSRTTATMLAASSSWCSTSCSVQPAQADAARTGAQSMVSPCRLSRMSWTSSVTCDWPRISARVRTSCSSSRTTLRQTSGSSALQTMSSRRPLRWAMTPSRSPAAVMKSKRMPTPGKRVSWISVMAASLVVDGS